MVVIVTRTIRPTWSPSVWCVMRVGSDDKGIKLHSKPAAAIGS